jgi:hypothetical protein
MDVRTVELTQDEFDRLPDKAPEPMMVGAKWTVNLGKPERPDWFVYEAFMRGRDIDFKLYRVAVKAARQATFEFH